MTPTPASIPPPPRRPVTSRTGGRGRGYDRLTAPGMESDGVIHGPSQVYPGAHEQRTLRGRNAVSHVGETQSPETRRLLNDLLQFEFSTDRRLP